MTVKELAKVFRMNVNQLSMISGYSRQGLYDLLGVETNINQKRFNSFLDHLSFISNAQYEEDIAQARIEKNEREKVLKELKELIKDDTENA